jgi:hypothetical protein
MKIRTLAASSVALLLAAGAFLYWLVCLAKPHT